jgi:hypothetical protein
LSDATKLAETPASITLIQKSEKYPVGHYLVRKNNKWIDSWLNYPSINNVHAGERIELPGYP